MTNELDYIQVSTDPDNPGVEIFGVSLQTHETQQFVRLQTILTKCNGAVGLERPSKDKKKWILLSTDGDRIFAPGGWSSDVTYKITVNSPRESKIGETTGPRILDSKNPTDQKTLNFFNKLSKDDEETPESKFIHLENTESPFNNQTAMPAIYVRDCYPKLLEKILKMFKDGNLQGLIPILGIILTGSSGLGKSVFGYYFIRHLIRNKISFVYSPSTTKLNYYFCDNKFYEVESNITRLLPDYYIVDGRENKDKESPEFTNPNTRTLVICSANEKYFKEYQKSINVCKIYMPYWTWRELEYVIDNQHLIFKSAEKSRFDKLKSRNIFDVYGGVARYVLDKSLMHTSHELKRQLLQRIRLTSLGELFDQSQMENGETSTLLLHFAIDSETFKCYDVVYPNAFILHQLTQILRPEHIALIGDSKSKSFYNQLYSKPFESLVHKLFTVPDGVKSPLERRTLPGPFRKLPPNQSGSKKNSQIENEPSETTQLTFSYEPKPVIRYFQEEDRSIFYIKENADENTRIAINESNYYRAFQEDKPSLDSFCINGDELDIYQMTVSEDHGICASNSLKAVIETMKNVKCSNKKVRFIFVTNNTRFKKTCRKIGDDEADQNVRKYIEENIEQYVLEVGLRGEFNFEDYFEDLKIKANVPLPRI